MSDVTKMTNEQLLEYFEAEGNKPFTSSKSPEWAEYETTRAELLRRLSRSQDGLQGLEEEFNHEFDERTKLIQALNRIRKVRSWEEADVIAEEALQPSGPAAAQDGVDVEGLAQRIESQVIADVIQWRGRSDESKAERILMLKAIIHSSHSSLSSAPATKVEAATSKRLETGVVQVEGDWPGIFIRADNAIATAGRLEILANMLTGKHELPAHEIRYIANLAKFLRECHAEENEQPQMIQRAGGGSSSPLEAKGAGE